MSQLIKSLIENCEIGARRDAAGWHFVAKGFLAVVWVTGIGTGIAVFLVLFR